MKVSPADINVGDRVRQNVDDGLNDLVQSIRDLGQLQPILVDSDWNLIAGRRRLRACELLGIQVDIAITTSLEDAGRKLLAERDENTCRKDFTPSEAVEMSRRIESLLKPAAEQRMKSGHNQHTEGSAKFAEGSTGEVRDLAAKATGYSRESIRKAAVVKDAAEAPDAPPEVVAAKAEMDATGKIDPAYKAVKAETQAASLVDSIKTLGCGQVIREKKPQEPQSPTQVGMRRLWKKATKKDKAAFNEFVAKESGHVPSNVGALANTPSPEEIAAEAAEPVELFRLKQLWMKTPKRIKKKFAAFVLDDLHPAPKPEGELQGKGVMLANEAINALKKIPVDDGLRGRAYEIVRDWITSQTPKFRSVSTIYVDSVKPAESENTQQAIDITPLDCPRGMGPAEYFAAKKKGIDPAVYWESLKASGGKDNETTGGGK